ncbi:MAG: ABC transporter permease [Metamycoplasmataceae bacterium]
MKIKLDSLKINSDTMTAYSAIYFFINKFFWKTKIGPLAFFLFPLGFMLVYFFVAMSRDISVFASGLPSYLSLGLLPIGLVVLPQMLVEIKSSILLRKIAVSNVSKLWYILIVFIAYFIILLFEAIYVLIVYFIFLNKDSFEQTKDLNWGNLIFSLISLFLVVITFGILIGVLLNNSLAVQLTGFAILFASLLFSGQFIPIQVIGSVSALRFVSLFSPLSYSLGLLNNTLIPYSGPDDALLLNEFLKGADIFNLNDAFFIFPFSEGPPTGNEMPEIPKMIIYDTWQKALNLIIPFILVIGVNALSWYKFKWSNR